MFKNIPKIGYIFDGSFVTVTDILRRVAPIEESVNDLAIEYYEIQSGEQPEDVAFKIYGDPKLYWTILLVNNIIDPYNEWYLTDTVLEEQADKKYGIGNRDDPHMWVLSDNPNISVDYDSAKLAAGDIKQVSHIEYEQMANQDRQNIKVVSNRFIRDFVNEYYQLMNE